MLAHERNVRQFQHRKWKWNVVPSPHTEMEFELDD